MAVANSKKIELNCPIAFLPFWHRSFVQPAGPDAMPTIIGRLSLRYSKMHLHRLLIKIYVSYMNAEIVNCRENSKNDVHVSKNGGQSLAK